MKQILRVALCVSLIANLIFGVFFIRNLKARFSVQFATDDHQRERESLFESFTPPNHVAVAFVGDSVTEYCDWSELLGVPAVNRGIAGDTTADLMHRLNAVLALHPDSVFLLIGTNDQVRGVDVTVAADNYRQIVREIQRANPAATIYLESVLPTRGKGNANIWIQKMNTQIAAIANNRSVFFVDVYNDFSEGGSEMSAKFSADGTHLNGAGYQILKHKLESLLTRQTGELHKFRSQLPSS